MSNDILIIGGGIAGASAAYELAGFAPVVLLETEPQCGYHSTGRSAASFTENYGNALIRRLVIASRAFLEAPPPNFAEYPLLSPSGLLTIARHDQLALLADALLRARSFVESITGIEPVEAVERVPILRPEYVAGAFYEPHSMEIDVDGLHHGFLRGAKARGARVVVDAAAESIERRAGRWVVATPAGVFSAAVLVNAAGAWADQVAVMAGVAPLGLTPKRRTAFTLPVPAGLNIAAWPMVTDVGEQFYFKPSAGHLFVSPADAVPTGAGDVYADDTDVALGIDRLERATTLNVARVTRSWAGLRTFAADASPVVGLDGTADGFMWLAGQGGYGIKTSPALSRACASLIRHGTLPDDLAALGITAADLGPQRLRTSAGSAPT